MESRLSPGQKELLDMIDRYFNFGEKIGGARQLPQQEISDSVKLWEQIKEVVSKSFIIF